MVVRGSVCKCLKWGFAVGTPGICEAFLGIRRATGAIIEGHLYGDVVEKLPLV